jgi:enoyl-CoA hydratase/carnithine racemase
MITLEVHDTIATITLDRAERRNALTQAMLADLERIADDFRGRGDVRAVVLRGAGRDFSVGADLGDMEARLASPAPLAQARRGAQLGARVMRAVMGIDQPTVCAVQGIATGGATCIATACDFRLAAAGARLGYGEVKIGINLMWHALGPERCRAYMHSLLAEAAALLLEAWGTGHAGSSIAPLSMNASMALVPLPPGLAAQAEQADSADAKFVQDVRDIAECVSHMRRGSRRHA